MKTSTANYSLPDTTLKKVKQLSGATTKRQAIIIALEEYIRRDKIKRLIDLKGRLNLSWNKSSLKEYRD